MGCISPQTYVAPEYAGASFSDIAPVARRYATRIEVEFKRNGEPQPRADDELRRHVARTLVESGVFTRAGEESTMLIKVVVNNIGDTGDAWSKGFKAGLSLGAAGSLVIDAYEFSIEFEDGLGKPYQQQYRHELHTALGNIDAPFADVEPTTPARVFGIIVEQVLLKFIRDLQARGLLSYHEKLGVDFAAKNLD